MLSKNVFKIFSLICLTKISLGAVIGTPSPLNTNTSMGDFETQVRLETEEFLNNIFSTQIAFFNKVKTFLKTDTKRYQDIETFVQKLTEAKQERSLAKKDELYWNSFRKIDKSALLLNKATETGLQDEEYQKVLEDNGIKDLLKNFMADVAIYFWKMAKYSGKVLETTIDGFVDNMQKNKVAF